MTRFKAVKYGTEDDWVEGWFFPRFWMAGNGVEESIFIRDAKGSEFEIKPETIHQEIGGEWYSVEEIENRCAITNNLCEDQKEWIETSNQLKEENAQLKAEVERLRGVVNQYKELASDMASFAPRQVMRLCEYHGIEI